MTPTDSFEDSRSAEEMAKTYLDFAAEISAQLLSASERQQAAQQAQMRDLAAWCQAILSGQPVETTHADGDA